MPATILLVEDNELSREILSRRLRKLGYAVEFADRGMEAIEIARERQPDLILMDISLPDLDGWETTRALRHIPQMSVVPVIALTAHSMPGDRERAMAAGCDEYETKPVEFNSLVNKIEDLLRRRVPANDVKDVRRPASR